jgi:hypothetical protein
MECNNDPPTTQTSGDIGVEGIMELDPGPIENDDIFDSNDPEIIILVQCVMTLYLQTLFHVTT